MRDHLVDPRLLRLALWEWRIGDNADWPTYWLPHYDWRMKRFARLPTIVLPLWIPFILFATYPAITMIRSHRWRKHERADGCCSKCLYNLRGNVSGICPECGTKIGPEALMPSASEVAMKNGSGWESNPPDTAKQHLNGFEDRGAHQEP